MDKGEKGTFEKTFTNQDFTGKYYTYSVNNGKFVDKEIIDPYALSAGVNGIRGYIPNFENDNPTGWDEVNYLNYDRKELTVWETHVADVTSSVTWTGTEANRKIFKGMYESGTTYTGTNGVKVKTGFDHIKELGVNAVQIVPLYDQDNDEINMEFNWGYNPLNYNVIEGGYSSNPYDGDVRIREFKELVQAYNKEGISIIMDVVYNHVMSVEGRNFDVLMPHYYFRYSAGKLTNGSGCGNETASEHYMYRKFMIDSVCFWLKEYKLGGFRFDLMGLHDLETMNLLVEEAKKINPDVVIYGEPWTGGTTPLPSNKQAAQANLSKMVGYGGFNDQLRDNLIKGGMNAPSDLGYVTNVTKATQGNMNRLIDGFRGITSASTSKDPNHAINYVTCHDNYTLYDRFLATGAFDPVEDAEDLVRMNVLSNAIVFTTQGTSFMLAGEEFLRTKGGDHNSYKSSYEVNELNYELKAQHMDMIEAYQKLIALKQNLTSLHLEKEAANAIVVNHSENFATAYFNLVEGDNEYIIMHTNGVCDETVYDLSGYTLYYSTTQGNFRALNDSVTLDRFETLIAYRPINN